MKSIYKKINISFFFYFLLLLSFISGLFYDVFSLFLIIIVHEFGHIIMSMLFKWKIKKIDITVCGGFITYDEVIDKPFKEELLISVAGVLMQIVFFIILLILNNYKLIGINTYNMLIKYNKAIMIFNIIPIVPLDGSKILNILLNIFLPYRKCLYINNFISLILIACIIFAAIITNIDLEISYIIMLSFILSKIIREIKDVPYLFNRFLFEKYKNRIRYKKVNYVKDGSVSNIKRQHSNYLNIDGKYVLERNLLRKRFD